MPDTIATPTVPESTHKRHPTRLTLMEEATIELEADLRANGGRLVPLTADDVVQRSGFYGEDPMSPEAPSPTTGHSDY